MVLLLLLLPPPLPLPLVPSPRKTSEISQILRAHLHGHHQCWTRRASCGCRIPSSAPSCPAGTMPGATTDSCPGSLAFGVVGQHLPSRSRLPVQYQPTLCSVVDSPYRKAMTRTGRKGRGIGDWPGRTRGKPPHVFWAEEVTGAGEKHSSHSSQPRLDDGQALSMGQGCAEHLHSDTTSCSPSSLTPPESCAPTSMCRALPYTRSTEQARG